MASGVGLYTARSFSSHLSGRMHSNLQFTLFHTPQLEQSVHEWMQTRIEEGNQKNYHPHLWVYRIVNAEFRSIQDLYNFDERKRPAGKVTRVPGTSAVNPSDL